MSLSFKFIPLTFLSDENEIKKQIRNTIILKYFFERNSETVHLEDLITGTQYGYNASALVQGRNKFLRISDITDGKVNWKTVPYCNCNDEETYLLFPNDILIARTGGTTGKSFLISEPPALSIYAGYLIRIRANEDTNPDYLNLFLNSYVYWSQIVSLNEDNFRPSVNANKLKKLILPKCDEIAQNDAVKIASGELINGYDDLYQLIDETLLKYDKLREIQHTKRNQLELQNTLKQCILLEAMQGKFTENWRKENPQIEIASKLLDRIKKEKTKLIKEKKLKKEKELLPITKKEIPFKLPESWVWCRLGEIAEIKRGKSPKYSEKGLTKMLNQKCVRWYSIDVTHSKAIDETWYNSIDDDLKIKLNDLLVNSTGDGTIGRSATADILCDNFMFDSHILRVRSLLDIDHKFMCYIINSQYGQSLIESIKGATSTKQTELGVNNLSNFPIPLPPLHEQKRVVAKIEDFMMFCEELEKEIIESDQYTQILMQAILKEAFEVKNPSLSLDSLFEDINYNLYVAMIHKQIENRLKINYGEVATQKTVFNINAFTDQKIPYNFINSNHGTFSPQLKDDLSKNSYLAKDRKGNGEVFIINPSKQKEVLDALSNPKNKSFVRAVNEVLDIYELPFINKETDKIELLNTVAKLIIDTKSKNLDTIYTGMQKWEIKQNGFKTKAEKFSKPDTKKMIGLIEDLGLASKLLQ